MIILQTAILAAIAGASLVWAIVCVERTTNQTLALHEDAFARRYELIMKGLDHEAVPYPPSRDFLHFLCLFFFISPSRLYREE